MTIFAVEGGLASYRLRLKAGTAVSIIIRMCGIVVAKMFV
jgi:hypothetical protein